MPGALDAAPGMKPGKLRDRLIEGRPMAELSRVLVQLKEDCPLPIPLDDFKLEQVPKEPLAAFLSAHGFTSLLKRLDDGKGSPDRPTQLNPAKADVAGAPASAAGNRQPPPEWPAVDRVGLRMRAVARAARALDRARLRRAHGGDRHRDQRPRRDARRADRHQHGTGTERRLLRPARPRRQRHVRREAGAGGEGRRALGAQAAARKRRRPQGRAEHQVRHQRVRPERRAGGAGRRHDDHQLRPRRRASGGRHRRRTRDGRALGAPPRPHHADLQGHLRQRKEADPVRRGPARPRRPSTPPRTPT